MAARFLIAAAASATVDVLWWLRGPRQLTGPIDVVGYPIWANYDYVPSFLAYRLIVYAFPAGVLLVYSLLAWRGPLRRPPGCRRRRTDARMLDIPADEPAVGPALAVAARLLLPAGVIAVAASTGAAHRHQPITTAGLLAGLAYVAGVLVLAALLGRGRARSGPLRWVQVRPEIPAVNGIAGAVACVAALWYVSQHSVVVVRSTHQIQHWPWLPGWLAALGVLAIAAWAAARLRGGRPALAVESRLLAVVVGAVAVFLITWQMRGQLGRFYGFDDAQSLVGANLLSKGYFPWRDQMFIHGLWPDALQSTVGFTVFGDTRWGSVVGGTVLLIPACWVILYLFAVWFSRRNRWFLAALALPLLAGVLDPPNVRFIFVPVVLVLLGETLARRSPGWCVAFMAAVVGQAILVPETVFLALPALAAVAAADLTHRAPGTKLWPALRRTYWCAAAGLVLVAAWCVFLAANHALGAWIEYFKVVGPSHDAEGAKPPVSLHAQDWAEFGLGIALVLITFWAVVARVRAGRSWSARDWVTVAAAGFVALYGEKALGRFDAVHVAQVFTVILPLAVLWLEQALTGADRLARARRVGTGQARGMLAAARNPVTVLAVAAAVLATVPLASGGSLLASAYHLPARARAVAARPPVLPGMGYVRPKAFDPSLVRDLATALDTYAGRNGPVLDLTNSLGYVYGLLNRAPASRFTHIDMANTPYAMRLVIDDLKRSRPPVVIFDSTATGLPSWDGVANNIRHYEVSQYVLRGWTPILRTHGELLLLRNDLMAGRPPVPRLSVPPQTAGLWFGTHACDWGTVPNFLTSAPVGASVRVPVSWPTKTLGVAHIPAGVTIARYALLTLRAHGTIGPSGITISDLAAGGSTSHAIVLRALPASGAVLGVRVGSCLQWHGYQSRTLYVSQTGGSPVDQLQLSGVG
jgi:hypothetical protein